MDKRHGTVEVHGETFRWELEGTGETAILTVRGRGKKKATQLGGLPPEQLADLLANEIAGGT
jgi:hypothetical protein